MASAAGRRAEEEQVVHGQEGQDLEREKERFVILSTEQGRLRQPRIFNFRDVEGLGWNFGNRSKKSWLLVRNDDGPISDYFIISVIPA